MPLLPSKAISVQLQGQTDLTHAQMRTHFIKVYPEQTKKVLQSIDSVQSLSIANRKK
jgi:hypothetical protein